MRAIIVRVSGRLICRGRVVVIAAVVAAIAVGGCGGAARKVSAGSGAGGAQAIARTVARLKLPAKDRAAMARALRVVRRIQLKHCPNSAQRARLTALVQKAVPQGVVVAELFPLCGAHSGG